MDGEYNITEVVEIESKDFVKCSESDEKESGPVVKIVYKNKSFAFSFPQDVFKPNEIEKRFFIYGMSV